MPKQNTKQQNKDGKQVNEVSSEDFFKTSSHPRDTSIVAARPLTLVGESSESDSYLHRTQLPIDKLSFEEVPQSHIITDPRVISSAIQVFIPPDLYNDYKKFVKFSFESYEFQVVCNVRKCKFFGKVCIPHVKKKFPMEELGFSLAQFRQKIRLLLDSWLNVLFQKGRHTKFTPQSFLAQVSLSKREWTNNPFLREKDPRPAEIQREKFSSSRDAADSWQIVRSRATRSKRDSRNHQRQIKRNKELASLSFEEKLAQFREICEKNPHLTDDQIAQLKRDYLEAVPEKKSKTGKPSSFQHYSRKQTQKESIFLSGSVVREFSEIRESTLSPEIQGIVDLVSLWLPMVHHLSKAKTRFDVAMAIAPLAPSIYRRALENKEWIDATLAFINSEVKSKLMELFEFWTPVSPNSFSDSFSFFSSGDSAVGSASFFDFIKKAFSFVESMVPFEFLSPAFSLIVSILLMTTKGKRIGQFIASFIKEVDRKEKKTVGKWLGSTFDSVVAFMATWKNEGFYEALQSGGMSPDVRIVLNEILQAEKDIRFAGINPNNVWGKTESKTRPEVHSILLNLRKKVDRLQSFAESGAEKTFALQLNMRLCRVESILEQVDICVLLRMQPYSVFIPGTTGIGKTNLISLFSKLVNAGMGYDDADPHGIYYRQTGTKFWENFLPSHHTIVIDDAAATAAQFCDEPVGQEIIRIANNAPFSTNQASVEDKGMRNLFANCLIVTANNLDLDLGKTANNPDAVLRRFQIIIEPVVKHEFRLPDSPLLDPSKIPAGKAFPDIHLFKVQRLVRPLKSGSRDPQLPDRCTLQRENVEPPHVPGVPIDEENQGLFTSRQLNVFLMEDARLHKSKQDALFAQMELRNEVVFCKMCGNDMNECVCTPTDLTLKANLTEIVDLDVLWFSPAAALAIFTVRLSLFAIVFSTVFRTDLFENLFWRFFLFVGRRSRCQYTFRLYDRIVESRDRFYERYPIVRDSTGFLSDTFNSFPGFLTFLQKLGAFYLAYRLVSMIRYKPNEEEEWKKFQEKVDEGPPPALMKKEERMNQEDSGLVSLTEVNFPSTFTQSSEIEGLSDALKGASWNDLRRGVIYDDNFSKILHGEKEIDAITFSFLLVSVLDERGNSLNHVHGFFHDGFLVLPAHIFAFISAEKGDLSDFKFVIQGSAVAVEQFELFDEVVEASEIFLATQCDLAIIDFREKTVADRRQFSKKVLKKWFDGSLAHGSCFSGYNVRTVRGVDKPSHVERYIISFSKEFRYFDLRDTMGSGLPLYGSFRSLYPKEVFVGGAPAIGGDCGLPLFLTNDIGNRKAPAAIVGWTVSAMTVSRKYPRSIFNMIRKRDILQLVEEAKNYTDVAREPVFLAFSEASWNRSSRGNFKEIPFPRLKDKYHPHTYFNWHDELHKDEHRTVPIGTVQSHFGGTPSSSRFQHTFFQKNSFLATKLAAPKFEGKNEEDPAFVALKQMDCVGVTFSEIEVRAASNVFLEIMGEPDEFDICRKLTLQEAINGIPGDPHVSPLNMSTSRGYPSSGLKRSLFSFVDGVGYVPGPEIKKDILELYDLAKRGGVPVPCVNTLKDEPRTVGKVARAFQAYPAFYTIVCRQFVQPIIRFLRRRRFRFGSMIGIETISEQWTLLAERLREREFFFDGDYKRFDKNQGTVLARYILLFIFDRIARKLGYSDTDRTMLRHLMACLVRGYIIIKGVVYRVVGVNLSGNPVTSDLNSIVNWLMVHICFATLLEDGDFEERVRQVVHYIFCAIFGDDLIVSSSNTSLNFKTLQEEMRRRGVVFTPAAKDGRSREFVPFEDLTFLKRRFVKEGSIWLMPIEEDSIRKQVSCLILSKEVGPGVQLEMSVDAAMRELCIFGKTRAMKFYHEMLKTASRESVRIRTLDLDYDRARDDLLRDIHVGVKSRNTEACAGHVAF